MPSSRKRGRQEMEAVEPPREPSLLERIRNMWEFANLAQWIFIFGRAVKIDENLDIEELEMECLKSSSTVLPEIGLALLKFVSSHRGLTPEIFDEYTRRQYVAKAPERNPFGDEEEPSKFDEFDVFTKIRVLQQLTQWTMGNPDRIRERMEEQKDSEQTFWRIEPFGWDSDDRTYIVLDDNRLYRRTDPPPPPPPAPKPKKNSKKAKAALRASKRRRVSEAAESSVEPAELEDDAVGAHKEDDGFGGMTWECMAVTLDELNAFVSSIERSRDPNEKVLRKRIVEDLLPLLEKQEEARKRKAAQKERELINLEKLATAKRSSRIAGKLEQQKQEEETREAERKKAAELAMAKKEQEKWMKLEKERESRMMTREQRLKEREARRILHEEELANLSEDSKKLEAGQGRLSERHLKAEIERKKQALEDLAEEEDWIFDCICGAYGQIDDGTHSIACDKCNIWQHSKCVGVSQVEADRDDFHFICNTCERRAKDAERAKNHPPIKIKLNRPGSSSSPTIKQNGSPAAVIQPLANGRPTAHVASQIAKTATAGVLTPPTHTPWINGQQVTHWQSQQAISPQKTYTHVQAPPTYPPLSNGQQNSPQRFEHISSAAPMPVPIPKSEDRPSTVGSLSETHNSSYDNSRSPDLPPQAGARQPSAHAFSPPYGLSSTNLPAPAQPQAYTFVNGNVQHHSHSIVAAPPVQATPMQNNATGNSPMTSSPVLPGYEAPPSQRALNGPYLASNNAAQRRSSINMPSPLASAPLLNPSNKANPPTSFHSSSSSAILFTPGTKPAQYSSPNQSSSPVVQTLPLQRDNDPGHASALPPAGTGLSPTKHSPPRPSSSNGSFGLATPSVLPPVASLSPSPQIQNLTPPVKVSEPERYRQSSQSVGP